MSKEITMSLDKFYIQACESAEVEPQKNIIQALKICSSGNEGELNLPSTNLSVCTWQILAKIIGRTTKIKKLNISNCLIPPRGLAALFAALSQGTSIEVLDMRGNDIQTTSVSHLGKLLRYNISLKSISLEWNNLGVFLESFSLFCDGLAANQTLEVLDMRNNQIGTDCAPMLANALARNTSIKTLDLRWNNLGWKGGQLLYAAFNSNQTLTKIKLQGNCIPMELVLAIEQYASSNATRQALLEQCSQRTELLAQQLRRAEEDRLKELQGLSRRNEEKLQQIVQASEARISQMENQLANKESLLLNLERQLQEAKEDVRRGADQIHRLQLQVKEEEAAYQQLTAACQKQVDELNKELAARSDEVQELQSEGKAKLLAEQKRRMALEAMNLGYAEEVARLEADLVQVKERLARSQKHHEEQIEAERASAREQVAAAVRDGEVQLAKLQSEMTAQRNSLRLRIGELERTVEELQQVRSDLTGTLARERGRREEEIAHATQEAKVREASRVVQLEEWLSTAREERLQLEKQVAQLQTQVMQLQQHNNTLIAEMAEPQRKLHSLHEELSSERLTSQRLRQELSEEQQRVAAKTREAERLQVDVESLQTKLKDLSHSQQDTRTELERERQRFFNLLQQRQSEIDEIRVQELERANVLYTAFNKFLTGVTPCRTNITMSSST